MRTSFPSAGFVAALTVCLAALLLQACLTGGSIKDDSPAARLSEASDLLEAGRCGEAMVAYEGVIAKDSAKSEAYFGYAQAALCLGDLDHKNMYASLVEYMFGNAGDADSNVFHAVFESPLADTVLNHYLQAVAGARGILRLLEDRDSLTLHWQYLSGVVTAEAAADTSYATRRANMQNYFVQADLNAAGYRRAALFPLSDQKIVRLDFYGLLVAAELLYSGLRIWDFDRNGVIDFSTRDSMSLKLGIGGGGFDSLGSWPNLEDDTVAVQNLNQLILNLQGGSLLCPVDEGACPSDSTNGGAPGIDSVIASLGDAILFYQFGDKLDNDGDGCVDEEILDEKDNDLDGFIDEDARVIPADKPDGVDNDRNGKMDPFFFPTNTNPALVDSGEAPVGSAVSASSPHVLGFVHQYVAANPGSLFVKIRKDDVSMAYRMTLQRDSLSTKSPAQLSGPLKAKLDSAKALIGGCWRNY